MTNVVPLRPRPRALEFFAGVGLARIGLERAGFQVVWSNDYEPDKHAMYQAHFNDGPEHTYVVGDIGAVKAADLPAASSWRGRRHRAPIYRWPALDPGWLVGSRVRSGSG